VAVNVGPYHGRDNKRLNWVCDVYWRSEHEKYFEVGRKALHYYMGQLRDSHFQQLEVQNASLGRWEDG
jgi:hypothetical protein